MRFRAPLIPSQGYTARLVASSVVVWMAAGGCKTLSNRGPVEESVAACRQLSQKSLTAMQRGEWDRAEVLLGQAIEASPTNVEARRQYAEALWHRGAPLEAVAQLEAALDLEREDPQLAIRAGEMYLVMHDVDRARRQAERALHLNPRLAPAWALRGQVMLALGQPQQALADLHRALGYEPDDPKLLLQIAELHRRQNQPQRALSTLQSLVDLYPPGEEPPRVLYLIGLAYSGLGRYDDAVESLYAASVRGPATAEILYSLGEAERLAGRPAAAEANARQALAIDPRHGPSLGLMQRLQAARETTRR